ncbi:amino acid adenylation domain-containing protein [Saccharothrix carnea]|uniref:Amino acid adenylation domain-containing protein n=1 Tax=Saccharothrix carnea TaxID=1280637 RepID=A0A2P8I0C3_SACCR|nr:AMP-binding protein [Saccharothrix carnea]PSL51922.1 amino acid adenylation domain-containing protein [Saccharothrix carnea]
MGRIGLWATRTPGTYVGYLAAQLAGVTVVPLNPRFPARRNDVIAQHSGLRTVLRDGRPVALDAEGAAAASDPAVAYVLFTSGSTGTPKGVPIKHSNVIPYVAHNVERYGVGPGDRLTQTFDLTFDPSVFDLFVAWGAGATLVVPEPEEVRSPVDFVNSRGITHWFSVPSVVSLAGRLRSLSAGAMPGLRWSLFAGEQLTVEQAGAWREAAPFSHIENLYGPTELTITCTAYRVPADRADWPRTPNGTVPIGRRYPHLEHVVLGPDGLPAEAGELCVRGPQRFDGYLDTDHNRDRFVSFTPANPDQPARTCDVTTTLTPAHWYRTGDRVRDLGDGELVHMGRLDSQVQVHGYRVELGEVEAALRTHPNVQDAVVTVEDADLTAVYTGTATQSVELSDWLNNALPAYMIPRRYTHLTRLPLNDNGKVDRRALASPTGRAARGTALP